ncbi:MAG: ubiquitin-like protein, partial [Candidatus Fonsibacter sp.]
MEILLFITVITCQTGPVGDERFETVIFNNGGDISIFTNVSGVSVQFDIDMSTKVAELVEDIVDTFAIPEDTFYFTYSSKILETSSTVGQCGMANSSNFQTVFRGKGGAPKVKQTIRNKTDKNKRLKDLKQSYEDEETELKACVKA